MRLQVTHVRKLICAAGGVPAFQAFNFQWERGNSHEALDLAMKLFTDGAITGTERELIQKTIFQTAVQSELRSLEVTT